MGSWWWGLAVLWILARSDWLERVLNRIIGRTLRRFTDLHVVDYLSLLDLERDHTIGRMRIGQASWLEGKTLAEADLPEEGVLILGIRRKDGSYVGAPRGRYSLHAGDTLVMYGQKDRLQEIHARLKDEAGDRASQEARARHEERVAEQDEEELEYEASRSEEED